MVLAQITVENPSSFVRFSTRLGYNGSRTRGIAGVNRGVFPPPPPSLLIEMCSWFLAETGLIWLDSSRSTESKSRKTRVVLRGRFRFEIKNFAPPTLPCLGAQPFPENSLAHFRCHGPLLELLHRSLFRFLGFPFSWIYRPVFPQWRTAISRRSIEVSERETNYENFITRC